ncbi:Glycoside hydrolase superfamily [Penicillium angulare]|uniref:chitinase n=1 Tax=Penicillium angulare TaxID=116970 RepID=A0A9W9FY58_9EURO|nr:Glycoside hydrolase superfamily [Penicillium angulare]
MRRTQDYLSWSVLLASLGAVQGKLDLTSDKNIAVYWGQNSIQAATKAAHGQQPLSEYCKNDDIDVIPMAFEMMINGPGGAPEVDFSVDSEDCEVFEGTQLKHCPKIAEDIKTCQEKGKTILLSIGGATYNEGGFKSDSEAKDGAALIWETFGPKQSGSKAKRPFDDAVLDGFDFDFEATVSHMAPFANELRALMDKDDSKQYFLTAAPQCPYPDAADKEILNGPVSIDAVWVQFYNNFCGVNNFNKDEKNSKYNFEEWDNWAKTVSKNKDVKVIMGVPADTTAASTGYVPADKLADVIEYSKKFESFGGVMMWDVSQAYANEGFIDSVRKALGGPDSGSSSSSNSASTTASAPSSTNSPNTSQSSNAPASSSSSSSSSASGSSQDGHNRPETTTTTEAHPKPAKPTKPTTTEQATDAEPTKPAPTETATNAEPTKPKAKPTEKPTSTTKAKPAPEPTAEPSPKPPANDDGSSNDTHDDDTPNQQAAPNDNDTTGVDNTDNDSDKPSGPLNDLLGGNLFGLLNGLRQANGPVTHGLTHGLKDGLTKNLRRANRIGYN